VSCEGRALGRQPNRALGKRKHTDERAGERHSRYFIFMIWPKVQWSILRNEPQYPTMRYAPHSGRGLRLLDNREVRGPHTTQTLSP
jgi:hypothetical protein